MAHKKKKPFRAMQDAAIGIGTLGVTTGALHGTSISFAGGGGADTSQALNTISGFAPIAATGMIGMSLLPKTKKKSKYGY